jgi:hypothetical protein
MKTRNALIPPRPFPGWARATRTFFRRNVAEGPGTAAAVERSSARPDLILATFALAVLGPALGARAYDCIRMKRLILTGIGTLAVALGAFAQGIISLDDTPSQYGVALGPGNYYRGPYGMEVWELNASSVPSNVREPIWVEWTYSALTADGFNKEATFSNQAMTIPGVFTLGDLTMPDVSPAGSTVVLALAVWNTSASSWGSMLFSANTNTVGGVLAFLNPTAAPTSSGPPPVPASLSGWNSTVGDLIMYRVLPIPEPSTLFLAGLGAAALLLFRQRR